MITTHISFSNAGNSRTHISTLGLLFALFLSISLNGCAIFRDNVGFIKADSSAQYHWTHRPVVFMWPIGDEASTAYSESAKFINEAVGFELVALSRDGDHDCGFRNYFKAGSHSYTNGFGETTSHPAGRTTLRADQLTGEITECVVELVDFNLRHVVHEQLHGLGLEEDVHYNSVMYPKRKKGDDYIWLSSEDTERLQRMYRLAKVRKGR